MGRKKLTQDKVEYGKVFGRVLFELREKVGMTQADMARARSVTRQQIHNIEVRANLGSYEIREYAGLLGVSVAEVFDAVETRLNGGVE